MITLRKAFRTTENEVCVMYTHNELRYDFVIYWNNIHPGTGEVGDYDLQLTCLSSSEGFNQRVCEAIRDGESDDNDDLELYLAIRDTFDRLDCEGLETNDNG